VVSPLLPLAVDPIAEAKRQWIAHGWENSADGMAMVTSLMRAQQLMLAQVEGSLKPLNLSFARFEMLVLLSFTRGGGLPMASASARLQVHPTSVTHTVDRLERDGLARREPHPTDGRATMIVLTEDGRKLAAKASEKLNAEVFSKPGMEKADVTNVVHILARFRQASGDFMPPEPRPDPL
jgi:DNA-binding MarR family transcriptional regulator